MIAIRFVCAASLAANGFAWASFAQAHDVPETCENLPVDEEAIKQRTEAPDLPVEWQKFASASRDWLTIRSEWGRPICVDIAWFDQLEKFERFNDRFVGFEWHGYEAWGYILIDTAKQGRKMDTGARPHFSPHDDKFATLQVSGSGWGGFEGFAVWQSYGWSQPLAVNTGVTDYPLIDWRIDRWDEVEDCLHISVVHYDQIGGDYEKLPDAKRLPYVAGANNNWTIVPGDTCPVYESD